MPMMLRAEPCLYYVYLLIFCRTASHEEETLDDIFNSPSQPSFATTEDDDDLFKQRTGIKESAMQEMDADDIASYIQQNLSSTETKLDLF